MNNTARGIRNNNPGNIRNSDAIDWKGEVDSKNKKDKAFEEFKTMPDGIRAMMVLLRNYQKKYKLRTVRELISRYAPRSENNTEKYIARVCWKMNKSDKDPVDLSDKTTVFALISAMCLIETGENISYEDMEKAWSIM